MIWNKKNNDNDHDCINSHDLNEIVILFLVLPSYHYCYYYHKFMIWTLKERKPPK